MSFEIPYKTLTPILGDAAPYDPTLETAPTFMNAKFNELLQNDKEIENQINVLNGKFAELQISTVNGWNIVSNEAYCTVSGKLMKFYVLATSGTTDSYTKVATIEGINAPLQYFNIYIGSTCVGQGYISENCICIMWLSQSTGNIRFEGTVVIR